AEPPDDPRIVTQSTWPGCRAPHVWLEPGRSTLDLFDGLGYVLVKLPGAPDSDVFARVANTRCIPFRTVEVNERSRALYEKSLLLVRPDGTVCWRGDTVPEDVDAVWKIVTGHTQPLELRV